MLHSLTTIHQHLQLYQYNVPVQVLSATTVFVETVRYVDKLCCLQWEVRLPACLLLCRPLIYIFLLCRFLHIIRLKQLFVLVPIASADLPSV